jgi:hypothetical protein
MHITTTDGGFTACLKSKGTDIFITTWAPTRQELDMYPHITLSSATHWNPREIKFPGISSLEQEEIEFRNIRALATTKREEGPDEFQEEDLLFDIGQFRNRIISSARITYSDMECMNKWANINKVKRQGQELPPLVLPGPLE